MIVVTVLYPATPGTTFDEAYYVDRHIPLLKKLWTPMELEHTLSMRGAGTPEETAAPYRVMAMLSFRSLQDFGRAAGAHGAGIFGDIPNFTDVKPAVQINEPIG